MRGKTRRLPMSRPLRLGLPGVLLALALFAVYGWRQTHVPEELAVSGGPFPRTVTVGADRILLAAPAQRIVLASTPIVDLAAGLVGPERVAALCDQAFTWSVLAHDPRGFGAVPQFHAFLTETILAFRPDLVLCNRFSEAETTAQLRRAGVPVVPLDHPRRLDRALAQLELVGAMLGAEQRAAELVAGLRQRVARLAARPGRRLGLRALTYVNLGTGAWSNGGDCMADELLRLAGLRNAGAETGRRDTFGLTTEELLALDPDLILVTARVGQAQDPSEALLRGDPHLAGLRALRNDRIVRVHPLDLATTSPEIVAAAERLATAVEQLLDREPR